MSYLRIFILFLERLKASKKEYNQKHIREMIVGTAIFQAFLHM